MKRLLLLALVLGVSVSTADAQFPRRVLLEEFTNTGCPPCATSDPAMEKFESRNIDMMAVLKYHTSGPDASDPFYIATKEPTPGLANTRGDYYNITGVPAFFFAGTTEVKLYNAPISRFENDLAAALETEGSELSPFKIDVSQTIEGNTITATVTVEAGSTLDASKDYRLACVFAERYNAFKGNNGTPYHTSIVRKLLPGLVRELTIGAIDTLPEGRFSMAAGQTKTFTFTSPIGSTWTKEQMMTTAFIQEAMSKRIEQAAWTIPSIRVRMPEEISFLDVAKGESSVTYNVTNSGTTPITVKVEVDTIKDEWYSTWKQSASLTGDVVIAPNSTQEIKAIITSPTATGYGKFETMLTTADGLFLAARPVTAFGTENKHIVIDADELASSASTKRIATAAATEGIEAFVLDPATLSIFVDDWTRFETIIYNAGTTTGIYSNTGDWDRLRDFIASGGDFALSSSVFASAYGGADEALQDNVREIFGVEPEPGANAGWSELNGVNGDPVSNGFTAKLTNVAHETELVAADDNPASVMFTNENELAVAMRRTDGESKVALLNFGMNMINNTANRTALVTRLYAWFAGTAAVKVSEEATAMQVGNYPNPFNPSTKISFTVTERAPVTLVVRDMMGREISTLVDYEMHDAGTYSVDFDASGLSSGTYVYELTSGSKKISNKMTLNK